MQWEMGSSFLHLLLMSERHLTPTTSHKTPPALKGQV